MLLAYLSLLVTSVVLYFFYAHYISLIFLIICICLPLFLFALNIIVTATLKVELQAKKQLCNLSDSSDNNCEIEITAHFINNTFFPSPRAKIYMNYENAFLENGNFEKINFALNANGETTMQLNLHVKHCGEITISANKIVLYDMLGITRLAKKLSCSCKVAVMPKIYAIKNPPLKANAPTNDSVIFSALNIGDDRSQVFDYHSYRDGDHVKNINWKLSTRLDNIMVKEFSKPLAGEFIIIPELMAADSPKQLDKIDSILSVFTTTSNWFSQNKIAHDVQWYNAVPTRLLIDESRTIYDVLSQVFLCKPYKLPCALNTFDAINSDGFYSQIFYIACTINEDMLMKLFNLSASGKLTILLVQESKSILTSLLQKLNNHGIEVCFIRQNAIEEDLNLAMK